MQTVRPFSMRGTSSVSEIPVRHILKSGEVRKDIKGYKVPQNHPVYQVLKRGSK